MKHIESDNYEQIKMAEEKLENLDNKYHENKGKKWIIVLILMIILGLLGFLIIPFVFSLFHSKYDRKGIESLCLEFFGNDTYIEEALTKEMMIVAFEYNSHEPRLFTKYNSRHEPDVYNVTITDAS